MNPSEPFLSRTAGWLAFASAVAIMVGIAPSQILLGLALAALLLSGEKLRLPPIKLPLGLFLLGTLIALAFSGDPMAGLPQVRKIYVFCELLVVYSALRDLDAVRWLFLTWGAFGGATAFLGFLQFARKVQTAHALGRDFYSYYVGERITGFMSHWNTFSAQEMFALIMLVSYLFFAPWPRRRIWIALWIVLAGVIGVGILLGETRGVWLATGAAGLYLLWYWRRWLALVAPIAILAGILAAPPALRERFSSILHPSAVDSNAFRVLTWSAGLHMIERHPVLGLGPEMPRIHFDEYLPAGTVKPEGSYIHLHNIYLEYAAERGIPVLLIFLWLIGKVLFDFWRGLRALPPGRNDRRFLLHGAIAVVLGTLVEGVVEYNLGDSEVLAMFLVVVACGYIALDKDIAHA